MSRRSWAALAGAGVVAIVVVRLADWDALHRAWRSLAAEPLVLVVALAAYTAGFVLRAAAWGALMPAGVVVPLGRRVRAVFAMLAVNHALPGPVGEVARARVVADGPGLTMRAALVSVAAARVVDAACIAVLAVSCGLLLGEGPGWLRAASLVALALPVGAWTVARRRGADLGWARLFRVAVLALPSWALEVGMLWAVASAAGLRLGWAAAMLATCGGLLAQVAAVLPGGVGTYEAGVASVLVALGAPAGESLAVAATTHAVKFVYAFGVGLPALAWRRDAVPAVAV
ncbi:MAG: glycosyltransferase 2 family protein [Acidimicrobiaceae bacterium]|nr:glycosyltransferase 2 family protein [Acidimicrobiaceae bacterium]